MKKKFKIEKMVLKSGEIRFPRVPIDEPTRASYQDPKEVNTAEIPTGQISQDPSQTFAQMIKEMASEFATVNPKFPIDYLEVIESLSIVNPAISQCVDNIMRLGNTSHKVVVSARTDGQKDKILDELNSMSKSAFGTFGGVDGFVNTLLAQIARGGAGSVELVVDQKISYVEKVVFVPLSSVRFVWDSKLNAHTPWQKTSNLNLKTNQLIELNTNTYQYCPLMLLDNSPYAIPPILAALEGVQIQREIIKNFKFVAKKMGLLGFVTFLLKAPTKQGKETDSAYAARLSSYLTTQAGAIKNNYRDGFALGFMDNFKTEHHSLMGSADGADKINQAVEQQIFSGLKSDPALHGRTYSTTETYAGVVYEKMLSMLANYQNVTKQILEYGYKLHLVLAGVDYDDLYVEFEPSKSLSSERDETAYATKIANLEKLYDQGIISQDQFAQEAGYDAPDLEDPRVPRGGFGGGFGGFGLERTNASKNPASRAQTHTFKFGKAIGRFQEIPVSGGAFDSDRRGVPGEDQNSVQSPTDQVGGCGANHNATVAETNHETPRPSGRDESGRLGSSSARGDESLEQIFGRLWHEQFASHPSGCGCKGAASLALNPAQKKFRDLAEKYFNAAYPSVKASRVKAMKEVDAVLKEIDFADVDSEEFANKVFKALSDGFDDALSASPLADNIRKQVQAIYKYYRLEDAEPFSEVDGKSVPNPEIPIKPSFNVVDKRAQTFLRESDEFYFGRFLKDPSTKKSLKSWISDEFLESGQSLRDPGALADFRKRFGDKVGEQDFKVLRVVETSVSRAKNWGNALTMEQAGAASLKIVGPLDQITCDWCKAMVGKVFPVAPVVSGIKKTMAADPADLPDLNPFLPGQFSPAEVEGLAPEALLAKGVSLPPYHPYDRHRAVVESFDE